MVRPDALSMIDDPSHSGAKEILSSAESLLRFLDDNEVERVCCINYVAPDVMGFTPEINDWIADFTRHHPGRLLSVGSLHPRPARAVRGRIHGAVRRRVRPAKLP